jgi:hypothetical protein
MVPGRIPSLYNICQVLLVGEGSLMEELLAELGEAEVVDIGSCKVLGALTLDGFYQPYRQRPYRICGSIHKSS